MHEQIFPHAVAQTPQLFFDYDMRFTEIRIL